VRAGTALRHATQSCRFTITLKRQAPVASVARASALTAKDLSGFVSPFAAPPQAPVQLPLPFVPRSTSRPPTQRTPSRPRTVAPPVAFGLPTPLGTPLRGKHAVEEDNILDLHAIELCLETRTTVCVKNVPHFFDADLLHDFISEMCPRGFDFLCARLSGLRRLS
jgi:hypothetical protein